MGGLVVLLFLLCVCVLLSLQFQPRSVGGDDWSCKCGLALVCGGLLGSCVFARVGFFVVWWVCVGVCCLYIVSFPPLRQWAMSITRLPDVLMFEPLVLELEG